MITPWDPLHNDGYQFWSGIGSGSPIIVGIGVFLRRHNCHVHGCWRIGRHPAGPYHVCSKHHPDVPGRVTVEHVHKAHEENQ